MGSLRRVQALVCAGLLALGSGARAGDEADPAEFYTRLESIGLKTEYLRRLVAKIELFFQASSDVAEASYGYLTDNVYIPPTMRVEGTQRIKFALETTQIATLIHELTHADNDVMASETAAAGTPERIHYDSMQSIWADLYHDPNHRFLGLARYPRMKADEVCGYFMGKSIMQVFEAVDDLVLYNTVFAGGKPRDAAEAARWGSTLFLPPADTQSGWDQRILRIRFGYASVYDEAMFQSSGISGPAYVHWQEAGRDWLKLQMYRGILGLDPPADLAELLRRLNTLDNEWIRRVRAKVAKARQDWLARQAAGLQPGGAPVGTVPATRPGSHGTDSGTLGQR